MALSFLCLSASFARCLVQCQAEDDDASNLKNDHNAHLQGIAAGRHMATDTNFLPLCCEEEGCHRSLMNGFISL
eukprot:1154373-Pelagomonas_calceolata.AAC.1